MNALLKRSFFLGLSVTILDSLLLTILLALDVLGPFGEVDEPIYQIGGTILFLGIYLFLFTGVFMGIRTARRKNDNKLSFQQALANGVLVSLFTALTSIIATMLLYEVFYPDYAQLMGSKVKEAMESQGLEPTKIQEKVSEIVAYYGTGNQVKYSTFGNLMTGFFYSLILGIFMKK